MFWIVRSPSLISGGNSNICDSNDKTVANIPPLMVADLEAVTDYRLLASLLLLFVLLTRLWLRLHLCLYLFSILFFKMMKIKDKHKADFLQTKFKKKFFFQCGCWRDGSVCAVLQRTQAGCPTPTLGDSQSPLNCSSRGSSGLHGTCTHKGKQSSSTYSPCSWCVLLVLCGLETVNMNTAIWACLPRCNTFVSVQTPDGNNEERLSVQGFRLESKAPGRRAVGRRPVWRKPWRRSPLLA